MNSFTTFSIDLIDDTEKLVQKSKKYKFLSNCDKKSVRVYCIILGCWRTIKSLPRTSWHVSNRELQSHDHVALSSLGLQMCSH